MCQATWLCCSDVLPLRSGQQATDYHPAKAYIYLSIHSLDEDIKDSDVTKNEDFRLQGEIVRRIVREYNELRRNLKMDYSEEEIMNGQILGIEKTQV